ncbi:MAG: site-2 protease family protein, partial [Perlucidibaca sp.]
MQLLQIVLAGLLILGPLIAIHEFGHFWVARRCGVRVLTFSIGFGPAIWSRTGRDGTEYRL